MVIEIDTESITEVIGTNIKEVGAETGRREERHQLLGKHQYQLYFFG